MKLTNLVFAAVAALSTMNASAAMLYLDSVDGVKDSAGNFVGPYSGRLDAVSYQIFCDDFDHHIGVPDSQQVNVSTISNLSLTRFGGLAAATSLYQQVFYLSSYLVGATNTDRADIQDAIWHYFAADAPNQGSAAVQGWLTLAANNYAGKNYSSYRILTDASNQYNGKQELFISLTGVPPGLTPTPEPGTWAMLLTGASGILVSRFRRKKAQTL